MEKIYIREREEKDILQKISNRDKKYILPKEGKQFSYIIKNKRNYQQYYNLCILLTRFMSKNNYDSTIYYLFKRFDKTDEEVYKHLFKYIYNDKDKGNSYEEFLSELYSDLIKHYHPKQITNYLDYGCGACKLTKILGKSVGTKNIYGTDVEQTFHESWDKARKETGIKFEFIKNQKIPFDIKFDVISCFMVLHHVPKNDLEKAVKNIYSCLNSGGILIIKEHDCIDEFDKIIIDIEHSLFMIKEHKKNNEELNSEILSSITDQNNNYISLYEWKKIFKRVGFELLYSKYSFNKNNIRVEPNKNFVAILKKL